MSVTQTVEVPPDRRLVVDVPREVPTGPVVLTFTPMKAPGDAEGRPPPIKERGFGCAKGQFRISEDFDEPLEDFKDYM